MNDTTVRLREPKVHASREFKEFTQSTSKESLFLADQLADEVQARNKKEKGTAVVRCGQTPSGGKHIGNLNDVVRAYFVYKSLQERGIKSTFIHSTDDRDPLKDVPKRFADLDGNWHDSSKDPYRL